MVNTISKVHFGPTAITEHDRTISRYFCEWNNNLEISQEKFSEESVQVIIN